MSKFHQDYPFKQIPDPEDYLLISDFDTGEIMKTSFEGMAQDNNHQHPIADIVGLQQTLNQKASVDHTHSVAEITGIDAMIGDKADKGYVDTQVAQAESRIASSLIKFTSIAEAKTASKQIAQEVLFS